MQFYDKLVIYTLYSYNLDQPHRSPDITLKDFNRKIDQWALKDAKIVKYVNPLVHTVILRSKYGSKTG